VDFILHSADHVLRQEFGKALPARTSTFWTLSRARESSWFACCDPSREEYQRLHPLGSKGVKAGRGDHAAFQLFSNGWKTGRDAYLYNFSFDALTTKVRQAVSEFGRARRDLRDSVAERDVADAIAREHSTHIHWDSKLKQSLRRAGRVSFSSDHIRTVQYRPFVKQHCYADPLFVQRPALMARSFRQAARTAPSGSRALVPPSPSQR